MQNNRQSVVLSGIPRSKSMAWWGAALAVGAFTLDLLELHGRGEAVLYVLVVLLFLWSTYWRHVLVVAGVCSLLTLVGFVLYIVEPEELTARADITNHLFSFGAIWLTAVLGLRMNHLSEALVASEARTRTIVESAAEGIITIDDEGTIESFNQSAAQMFGYEIAEVTGQNVSVLVPSSERAALKRGLAAYRDSGETRIIGTKREVTGLRKDGTTFPILIAINEMRLEQRRLCVGIVLDMTELRGAQEHAIRVQRLAAIGEAMAGLAHESRNALQRSQAALEMLAREIDGQAEAKELLDRIQAAQDDLHSLYEEVRGYAAPIRLKMTPCRVDALMQSAWEKMREAQPQRDVRLVQTGTENDLTCDLDPFPIRRALRNIIDNSLEAIEGPVCITVSYADTELNGRPALEISLRDNGPGLPVELREKIFEPFFTTKATGTGLGMAIARRYIEAHGGMIDVAKSSAQNSPPGAAFRIILPRTQL